MIKLINSYNDFKALKDDWNSLLTSSKADSVFLRHEWFDCWWEAFGKNRKQFILLYRDGGDLEGIAAFMIFRDTYKTLPFKRLNFIEDPNSPHVDFIIKQGKERKILEQLITFLYREKRFWDVAVLSRVPSESATAQILPEILRKNKMPLEIRLAQDSPYIPISTDWEKFWKSTTQKFKKRLRSNSNRLKKAGEVMFEEITNLDTHPNALKEAFEVSSKCWKAKYCTAMNSNPQRIKFFTNLSKRASENGWLSLWFLKLNGQPIAMEYHLKYQGKTYAMRGDFDEAYKHLSPGAALEAHIIKHCFHNNLKEYNFCGQNYEYKLHWTPFSKRQDRFLIYNSRYFSQILYMLQKYLPILKKTLNPLIESLIHASKTAD